MACDVTVVFPRREGARESGRGRVARIRADVLMHATTRNARERG